MGKKAAFSAVQEVHRGEGAEKKICYSETLCPSNCWEDSVFTVPRDGIFFFSISFMRDATKDPDDDYQGCGDDAEVQIWVDDRFLPYAYAHVGENSVPRSSASATFLLPLKEGQKVTTRDWMAKGGKRAYRHCVFTGYRVAKT